MLLWPSCTEKGIGDLLSHAVTCCAMLNMIYCVTDKRDISGVETREISEMNVSINQWPPEDGSECFFADFPWQDHDVEIFDI